MNLTLRQYQKDILNKLYRILKIKNSCLLSLPTGAGKTVLMSAWAEKMAKDNKKTLIIVDREELVFQTLKYFHKLHSDSLPLRIHIKSH